MAVLGNSAVGITIGATLAGAGMPAWLLPVFIKDTLGKRLALPGGKAQSRR